MAFRPILIATLLITASGCLSGQDTTVTNHKTRPSSEKGEQGHDATHTNRLASESSPYLLQHAHNPVDWYPWGDEAIERAQRENKMIFLSVGYAACHWCHVMERESFVDPEIAKFMNEHFVCVKVDREERPDVDQIYMTSVQLITGQGGWPMSVFLLPDTRPFFGGTYFPPRDGDRGAGVGFLTVLKRIDEVWRTKKDIVETQAETITEAIKASQGSSEDLDGKTISLDAAYIGRVASALEDQFDPTYGGFGYSVANPNRPKFPEPSNLVFLLDRSTRESVAKESRDKALAMLVRSLDGMISGAMYDHLGGGFHRYSVDRRWQIPHFEKMLYDNGQLASVYAEAYQLTKNPEYKSVVEGTCDFVLRELRAPGGAFYSALDADSEGEEGKFYRWTEEEIKEIEMEVDGFARFAEVFRLLGKPNFEGEYFVPDPGKPLSTIARDRKLEFGELTKSLQASRSELFTRRNRRTRPITDIKILTAWNGLMIAGLADAGRILQREDYVDAAATAADFVLNRLADENGRLRRSFASNEAKLNGYIDDYAFMISGLIALHRATGDAKWLASATKLMDAQLEWFWDEKEGGFYFTSKDHPTLIVRVKDPADGAIPSGTSVSAENLLYLATHTANASYRDRLSETFQSILPMLDRAPGAVPRIAATMAASLDQAD